MHSIYSIHQYKDAQHHHWDLQENALVLNECTEMNDYLQYGIGFYSSDLSLQERMLLLHAFEEKKLRILVATR